MYLALMRYNFKQQFAYRASLYLNILGSIIRIYIQVCIWQALLRVGATVEQTVEELVTYTVMAFLINTCTSNDTAHALAAKVKSGSIALDLIRPMPLKWYLFYQQLSGNVFYLIFGGVPVMLFALIMWRMELPGISEVLFGLVSVALAVLLTFFFQYMVGLLVFWLKDVTYTSMITGGVVELFSGSMLPLWFYPEGFLKVCELLPFRFMVFEPISVFLGEYHAMECLEIIGMQLFWVVLLGLAGDLIWKKVQKNITIQGG